MNQRSSVLTRRAIDEPCFEMREASVIVRPWETTIALPVLTDKWMTPEHQFIMGIECVVAHWFVHDVALGATNQRGFSIMFPNSRVIAVDLLPDHGCDLVDAYVASTKTKWEDIKEGHAQWMDRTPRVHDHTSLLALIRHTSGWKDEDDGRDV